MTVTGYPNFFPNDIVSVERQDFQPYLTVKRLPYLPPCSVTGHHTGFSQFPGLWCGEGNGTPLQYSCLENPMDGGAWGAAVHGVAKSRTRLNDFPFTFHVHALEKEMATHSSVLAWRMPGTGEPGGLPSMGSHGAGHDWSDLAAAAAVTPIMKSIYYLRDWPVDLLNTNELKLLHDVWDTCTSSKIDSWVIKKVWETHFISGA